jgi:uncharacterized protein (DUF736 family)
MKKAIIIILLSIAAIKTQAQSVRVEEFSFDLEKLSFYMQVTEESGIEQYRILLEDQDKVQIGYTWFYARTTPSNMYRVYDYSVSIPECTKKIYASLWYMEKGTTEYKKVKRIKIKL